MARPAKNQPVALGERVNLTAGIIERLACPQGKEQVFLRDSLAPGLCVRVSAQGAKTFVFERKVGQRTVRRTIADVRNVSIEDARDAARQAYLAFDQGVDPWAEQRALVVRKQAAADKAVATVAEAWAVYLADRKDHWGDRHYSDHEKLSAAGGEKAVRGTRGTGVTKPGVLHSLMALQLSDLTAPTVEAWAATEAKTRATQARLGARMLSAFVSWCEDQDAYSGLVLRGSAAVKTRRTRAALGKAKVKTDSLLREQLPAWFAAVRKIGNPSISAYLQALLLTGARPIEVREMRWGDIDWAWQGLNIRDKVEGDRIIPLTPYVASLLAALPRRNDWVFSSPESASGQITSPNTPHEKACVVAGIKPVTLHGLRRSFKSLTEWLEMPAGVVAQIMGHKPSATAEKHYTVRPLDLLRLHHEKIETWVLEQAGVPFSAPAAKGTRLKAV